MRNEEPTLSGRADMGDSEVTRTRLILMPPPAVEPEVPRRRGGHPMWSWNKGEIGLFLMLRGSADQGEGSPCRHLTFARVCHRSDCPVRNSKSVIAAALPIPCLLRWLTSLTPSSLRRGTLIATRGRRR